MLGFRGVIGLCCLSDCEPPGTGAGVPDGALKPECDTWAVCHGHKHRQCDTWQDRSWGCNTRSQNPADSKDERRAVQLSNFPDTLKSKPVCLLSLSLPFSSLHGLLNKSRSQGSWSHQFQSYDETVCINQQCEASDRPKRDRMKGRREL